MLKIRRALISVWDKKGIVDFAKKLSEFQIEIISTGKTASLLRKSGIATKEVSNFTSFPEILSGRVKTIHPKIFGGILANKKHPLHMEEIKNLGIQPFDMVVVNLYPFKEKLGEKLSFDEMLEYIDIGGHALLRAAAKNFKNVACISSPQQYKTVIDELEKNKGILEEDFLKKLAEEAFFFTKEYDYYVYKYFKGKELFTLDLEEVMPLRYGENPHQKGVLYREIKQVNLDFKQLQGKELSYNNLLDLDTAVSVLREFEEPTAVIIKHASICGIGIAKTLSLAYKRAFNFDPISSFGGIIGLNKKVDKKTALNILKSDFKECIIAPGYCREALRFFSSKKNMRILEADIFQNLEYRDVRSVCFGYLVQDLDLLTLQSNNLKIVTKRKPTSRELKDLLLAWKIVKFVKSNAIVIVKNSIVLGIGGGQPSRIGAMQLALSKKTSYKEAVVASDGFFPKEDSIKIAHQKGIKAIIQPGGSIKDNELIKLCDSLGISMVFTGIRHFRH